MENNPISLSARSKLVWQIRIHFIQKGKCKIAMSVIPLILWRSPSVLVAACMDLVRFVHSCRIQNGMTSFIEATAPAAAP